jgi:hypothetical protein
VVTSLLILLLLVGVQPRRADLGRFGHLAGDALAGQDRQQLLALAAGVVDRIEIGLGARDRLLGIGDLLASSACCSASFFFSSPLAAATFALSSGSTFCIRNSRSAACRRRASISPRTLSASARGSPASPPTGLAPVGAVGVDLASSLPAKAMASIRCRPEAGSASEWGASAEQAAT